VDAGQIEAAEALGLKRRVVQYYEKGERDGEKVVIPKSVSLACYALAQGVTEYKGPSRSDVQALRDAAREEKKAEREKEAEKGARQKKREEDKAG
jgi:predicted transcriptional regulator